MTLAADGGAALTLLLASVRVVAWLMIAPPLASRSVPTRVKVLLAVGLSLAIAPALQDAPVPTTVPALVAEVLTQVAVGAAMGFVTMLLLSAVAAAGALVDVLGGFSLAQGLDPTGANSNTVIGSLHQVLATLLLFASGGHTLVVGGVLRTFTLLPIGAQPNLEALPEVLARAMSVFFVTAVQVALPMAAVLFVADLGLALMTKIAPQLNALNVMFPAKIGLTLMLVGLSFAALPGVVDRLVDLVLEAMDTLTRPAAP